MRDYIRADEQGSLMTDEDARAFGVPPASPEFLEKAIASLAQSGPHTDLGRRLLERYVPEGPDPQSDAEPWRRWWLENKPYLFFSDTGGYRWYVDRLAKARSIPSGSLRGPARVTLPARSTSQ